jgi:UDP-2,3-diacylglucosamine pyrophosphatase LpxH
MSKKWKEEEENLLKEYLTQDPREIYNIFVENGIFRTLESIRKKVSRLRDREIQSQETEELLVEQQIHSPLHLLDPSIVKQQVDLWLREVSGLQPEASEAPFISSRDKTLVIVISDVHWGKQTHSFNIETANKRILSIPEELITRELPHFDEIRLLLLGDLVEGEGIFEHQANIIEAPVITAHKEATETCWKLACALSETFQVQVTVETSPGNHGRMSKGAHPHSNWDNAIAQSLAMISNYAQHPNVTVNLNLNNFNLIDIKGSKVLLNHEGIRHLGTPAMVQRLAGWIISKNIDILVHGHWHNRALDTYLGRSRVCNGSAAGPDDLGEKIAREDPASQVYFFVDPERPGHVVGFDFIEWR